jgi:nucleolar protein 14
LRDITSGLFLSTLILQFEALSKRFVPEATNFLTNVVLHLAPHRYTAVDDLPGSFPAPEFMSEMCQALNMDGKASKELVTRKPQLINLMNAEADDEQAKADLLSLAFELLGRYADIYKGIEGFVELFEPILTILENIEQKKLFSGHKVSNYCPISSSLFSYS